ncbi:MAG: hypothetical protein ACTSVD_04925 [Candidatus Thorarchaeota archaeon]|nr:MAG: hypothetical protein DRO73_08445 [Candidatus Thorarchaeota archaeon]RLI60234.1 MAG: hypothetical protein DRO93_07420 [Candidatus Thorarchaeota archaeon]
MRGRFAALLLMGVLLMVCLPRTAAISTGHFAWPWVFNHLYDYVKMKWPHLVVLQSFFPPVYDGLGAR